MMPSDSDWLLVENGRGGNYAPPPQKVVLNPHESCSGLTPEDLRCRGLIFSRLVLVGAGSCLLGLFVIVFQALQFFFIW